MNCNGNKCFNRKLHVIKEREERRPCSQHRTQNDTRDCGSAAVAYCSTCGGSHCPKHVPSKSLNV